MAQIAFEARFTIGNFVPIEMMCKILYPTAYYKRTGMSAPTSSPELVEAMETALGLFAEKIVNLERIREDPSLMKSLPDFKGTNVKDVERRTKYLKYFQTDESMFRPGIRQILKKLLDISREPEPRIQNLVLYSNYDNPGLLYVIERVLSILIEEPQVFCTAADWGHPFRDGVNYGDFRVVGAARKTTEVMKQLLFSDCYVGDTIEDIQNKDLYFFDSGRPSREILAEIGEANYFKMNSYTRYPIYEPLQECFDMALKQVGLVAVPGYAEYVMPYLRTMARALQVPIEGLELYDSITKLLVAESKKYNIERRQKLRFTFENDTPQIIDRIDHIWSPKELKIRIPGQREGGRKRMNLRQSVAAAAKLYNTAEPSTPPEVLIMEGFTFDRATGTWIPPPGFVKPVVNENAMRQQGFTQDKETGKWVLPMGSVPHAVESAAPVKSMPRSPPGPPPKAGETVPKVLSVPEPTKLPPNVLPFPSNTNAKPPTAAVPKPVGRFPPVAPQTKKAHQRKRKQRRSTRKGRKGSKGRKD